MRQAEVCISVVSGAGHGCLYRRPPRDASVLQEERVREIQTDREWQQERDIDKEGEGI